MSLQMLAGGGEDTARREATALRALAHPLRLRLLGLLAAAGTLTSTEAARHTGENSANCSFHLRLLAKYGFVEQAAGPDRRARPWRLARTPPIAYAGWGSIPVPDAHRSVLAGIRDRELAARQLRIFDPDAALAA